MNWKYLRLAILIGWWGLCPSAWSQTLRTVPDHPSHRYLPLPGGKGSVSDQILSLQQLSQAFSSGDQSPAPFSLSPDQLKQLDAAIESFRDEKGQLNIPSPDSVPQQWIDSVLPDPQQQQMVKELWKEYSRSRNSKSDTESDDKAPAFPKGSPADRPANNARDPFSDGLRDNAGQTSAGQDNTPNEVYDPFKNSPFNRDSSAGDPNGAQPPTTENQITSDLKSSDSSGRNDSRPPERASTKKPSPNASSRRTGSDDPNADTSAGERGTGSDQLPANVPPDLRKLFETLKQIQQQRALQELQDRDNSSVSPSNTPSGRSESGSGSSRDSRSNRQPRTGTTPRTSPPPTRNDRTPGTGAPRGSASPGGTRPNGTGSPYQPSPNDARNPFDQATNRADGNADGDPNSSFGGNNPNGNTSSNSRSQVSGTEVTDANGNSSAARDANGSLKPDKPKLTPFDEGYDFSAAEQEMQLDPSKDPFADQVNSNASTPRGDSNSRNKKPTRPAEPFNVTRMAQEARNAQKPDPTTSDGDIKKTVNELGLGPALQRIVQKTIQEKGLDSPRPDDTRLGDSQSPQPAQPGKLTPPSLPQPSAQATENLTKWANSVATSPGTTTNTKPLISNTGWGKWMREAWQAIAEAPTRSGGGSGSSSAAAASASSSIVPDFQWTNSMTIAGLLVATLIGLLFWLSRRRVAELSDATAAQAEWVRTVIAQGLKTRADVVRAFHQLVKQSRAVSDWWTHRSIVKHFSTQTPQLASAITELAVVYEQARYYPEDVELSPQQLAQVRTLLESVKIPTSSRA